MTFSVAKKKSNIKVFFLKTEMVYYKKQIEFNSILFQQQNNNVLFGHNFFKKYILFGNDLLRSKTVAYSLYL